MKGSRRLWDFEVEVEDCRNIHILQLTDIQVIDAAQNRYPEKFDYIRNIYWATDKTEDNYKKCLRQVIERSDPVLILITGDLVYGRYDDSGEMLKDLIAFMDSFQIPWAPIFGNHEKEAKIGVDRQCRLLEASKHCLFLQRSLSGDGNYSVALLQNGIPIRVFFMLDSGGGEICAESLVNGHTTRNVGFMPDQRKWYIENMRALRREFPSVKLSVACHIQLYAFKAAMEAKGFDLTVNERNDLITPVNLGLGGHGGDFGYLGRPIKTEMDTSYTIWNEFKELGVDSIFAGHEHCNSLSLEYEGIRLQYGQKSSTYDRANYRLPDGSYKGYGANGKDHGKPVIGGTLIPLAQDGSITTPRIMLYDE